MLISPSNGNHEHIHLLNHGVTNEKNGWWMFQDQTLDIMTYDHKSLENNFQLLGAQDRNLLRSAYRSIVPAARIERRQIYSCFFLAYRFSFVFFMMDLYVSAHMAWKRLIHVDPTVACRHDPSPEAQVSYSGLWPWNSAVLLWPCSV